MKILFLFAFFGLTTQTEAAEVENHPVRINMELGLSTGLGYQFCDKDPLKFIGSSLPIFIGVRWEKISLRMPINGSFFSPKRIISLALSMRVLQVSESFAFTTELGVDYGKLQETNNNDESIRTNRVNILVGLERSLNTQPKGFFSWSGIGVGIDGQREGTTWLRVTPMLKGGIGYAF